MGLHCQQRETLNFKNDSPFSPVTFSFQKKKKKCQFIFILIYFSGSEVSDLGLHCQQRDTLNFKNDSSSSPVTLSFQKKNIYILVHFYSHIF